MNREKQRAYDRKYARTSLIAYFNRLRERAIKRKIPFDLDKEWFKKWYTSQESLCYYCKKEFSTIRKLQIDRMTNDLGYTKNNLCLACQRCNRVKSNMFTSQEMLEIAEKYNLISR